jgi:flagellar basal-body rod protein FlgB
MAISGISDSVTAALHLAINGLDARQQAIASNIANVETPNYLAKEVKFEDSLKAAYAGGGDPMSASISVSDSTAPLGENGNNVSIDFELMAGSENLLRQKLVIQALNSKYTLLRTAMAGN